MANTEVLLALEALGKRTKGMENTLREVVEALRGAGIMHQPINKSPNMIANVRKAIGEEEARQAKAYLKDGPFTETFHVNYDILAAKIVEAL
jgi:hypothetical protein